MSLTSLIRSRGGSAKREVLVADIQISDFRSYLLFLSDVEPRWIAAVARYYEDLQMLLACARSGQPLPAEFFVPDLWDCARQLPSQEKQELLDAWHLGHDLGSSVMVGGDDEITREYVAGLLFTRGN